MIWWTYSIFTAIEVRFANRSSATAVDEGTCDVVLGENNKQFRDFVSSLTFGLQTSTYPGANLNLFIG